MRSPIFIVFAMSLFALSCRKEKNDNSSNNFVFVNIPLGTISADVDGVPTIFNNNAIADTATRFFDFYYNEFNIDITGFQGSVGISNNVDIYISKVPASPIADGLYPLGYNSPINSDTCVTAGIFYDTIGYANIVNANYISWDLHSIRIISMDSTIKGTFQGEMQLVMGFPARNPPATHSIKNGEFYVRIQP
jgi:hypothetical protein